MFPSFRQKFPFLQPKFLLTFFFSYFVILSLERTLWLQSFIHYSFICEHIQDTPADTAATEVYKKFKKYLYTYMSIAKTSGDQVVSCQNVEGWKYEDVLRWSMAVRAQYVGRAPFVRPCTGPNDEVGRRLERVTGLALLHRSPDSARPKWGQRP